MQREYLPEQRAKWRASEKARIAEMKVNDPAAYRAFLDRSNKSNKPRVLWTPEQKERYKQTRIAKRRALIESDPELFYAEERRKSREARLRRIAKDGNAVENMRQSASWFKHKYGITLEQRDVLYATIRKCELCDTPYDELPRTRHATHRLHIDHDHATGKYRGLLCIKCNMMIGLANDSPATLQRAIEYLHERG